MVASNMSTVCPPCGSGPLRLIDDDGARIILLIDRDDGKQMAVEIARSEVRSIIHAPVPTRQHSDGLSHALVLPSGVRRDWPWRTTAPARDRLEELKGRTQPRAWPST